MTPRRIRQARAKRSLPPIVVRWTDTQRRLDADLATVIGDRLSHVTGRPVIVHDAQMEVTA